MHVVFLGTGGYHPTDQRQTNCTLIREAGIVFDAGTGFFRLSQHLQHSTLNILLTHAHLDHICGIVYLSAVLKHSITPIESVHIYAPPGVRQAVETLFSEPFFAGSLDRLPVPVTFHEVTAGTFDVENVKVLAKPFAHGAQNSWGYRVTKGFHTVAYITDTFITDEAIPLLKDADLAICEAYYRNKQKEQSQASGHSYPLIVGQVAKKAGAKKLILTHINPTIGDQASAVIEESSLFFPGAQLATDGRVFEL